MQPSDYRILLVDDEEGIRFTLACILRKEGFQVDVAAGCHEAVALLEADPYDVALVDIMLAGESGIDLLRDIKAISPAIQVIMFTGYPEVESAAEAVRLGAFDYITKPVRHETLMLVTRHALKAKMMNDERERYRANLDAIFRSVSDSIIMVDKEGRLAHFNVQAGSQCGYREELIGSNALTIDLGCGGLCRKALLEVLSSNSSRVIRRFECCTPEGKSRIVSFNATPVAEADGTISGAVAVIRDETRLVDLERTLQKRGQFHSIIGVSAPMQRVYSLVEALADVQTTVLINGESGTGKELVAAALHSAGGRAAGPFVRVNCSALSESLLESELFGHVRGAFTGAIANKAGRFEKAHGGTLFLDEIGDISPAIQMRLLRVLQESEFERVGDSTPIKVDVRIIAATNQNLTEMVTHGKFRQDLYYRLNVVRLALPALKERHDDIELLVAHFIAKFNGKFGRDVRTVSDDVMEIFKNHTWPGNVRELEHVIEHATILCKSDVISVQDLPLDQFSPLHEYISEQVDSSSALPGNLTLEEALVMTDGNKTNAARLLGISRRTVYRHLGNG
ncbi:MAG TPA: sigma-54-dependent Fis family transcriptional regulator [Desulfuromonadaceae bacterium]|jgi:PAS domain S-box-containing protein